jgi:MinD-like ATPase involved in chromosome partitioning or flagellar assembly
MTNNSGNSVPDHLFTWVDVSQHFAGLAERHAWPGWLREVDAYWDSVRFVVREETEPQEVWTWLREVLGPLTVAPERGVLLLDQADRERPLPIEIEQTDDLVPLDRRPRWADRRVVAELSQPLPAPGDAIPDDIPIVSFHSFKGGVGRTLHCVALARRLADTGKRVLLVDADLEAPGITWMVAESSRIDFAYEDFLSLVHGSRNEDFTDAIDLGKKFLLNQEHSGIIVMPARRNHLQIATPYIEPTNLLTADRDLYVLTEALAKLGRAVTADVILIDLRAGVSELSAPLLLDPRVSRIFVTTISDQSVRGTRQVLRELARRAPARRSSDPNCSLIVTQFNGQDHQERLLEVMAELREAALLVSLETIEPAQDVDIVGADVAIPIVNSAFEPRLLSLPASWSDVVDVVDRTRLADLLTPLVESLPNSSVPNEARSDAIAPLSIDDARGRLAATAADLVFAESSNDADFLATDALRSLAEAHRTELPIEVIIGGKGAGKTFTFLQVCQRANWATFVEAAGVEGATLQVPTIPVLASENLHDATKDAINARREAVSQRLTGQEPASSGAIRDTVVQSLAGELTLVDWRRVWLTCFARAIGLDADPANAEDVLTDFARHHSAIFVLDGLEDLFQEFVANKREQLALRALLVGCPEWLRTLRGRPLGMVAFVRRDLAQEAIRQNFGQFEKRYEKYALRWNREEALRLAAWVCHRGQAVNATGDDIRAAGKERLSEIMQGVWGDKMGSSRSKEARSEVWFFAALSDFRQQIQARDIVSFLATAARESVDADSRWSDRVLAPGAMRNALPVCSRQKIEAITAENPPVGALLDRLSSLDVEFKKLPFRLETVGLSSEQAQLLDANGVVFREDDQYWIPEIFRHGLGFSAVGRPRVVAVANLVRRRNDSG